MDGRTSRPWLPVALIALTTCNKPAPTIPDPVSRPSDPSPLGAGCDAQSDSHCGNLVNRVLVPMFRGSNLPMNDESSSELCRRMALDLIGRIPTAEENTQCEGESSEQM